MSDDMTPDADAQVDLEPVISGGTREVALYLVQLIEARAHAERLALKALVQELSTVAGPETAVRIQTRLDAVRCAPAMLSEADNSFRSAVAQELSRFIEALDDLIPASGAACSRR